MANMMKKFMICVILTLSLTLSACGGVLPPEAYEPYEPVDPNVTQKPTQTLAPTEKPLEDKDDFGVVKLETDEDMLAVYYGIVLPESGEYEAQFQEATRGYEFAPIVIGTTVDNTALDNCKISVTASVRAYNALGNSFSQGLISNMTSKSRSEYFGNEDYIHGITITYPGTYYVTYKVAVENFAEEVAGRLSFEKSTEEYKIERKFTIDKVEAYISVESGFYFVKERGADVKKDAQLFVTTKNGWDISDLVFDDIDNSCRAELSVPRKMIPIDEKGVHYIDVVATKGDKKINYSQILSKYFNLNIEGGTWYVVPAEEEIVVSRLHEKIAGLGFDRNTEGYDYLKFDEYMEVVKGYQALSETQKVIFSLYPDYLLKNDVSFSYNDYYDARAGHDWLMKLVFDSERMEVATTLESLVGDYKESKCEVSDICKYLASLSADSVAVDGMIHMSNTHMSDLEFAVAKVFDGKLKNNGYVDLQINGEVCTFADSNRLVNSYFKENAQTFELKVASIKVLSDLLKWNGEDACQSAIEYFEAYNALDVSENDSDTIEIHSIISEFVTLQVDDDNTEAVLTGKFKEKDVYSSETNWAINTLREELEESLASLADFQKDTTMHAKYIVSRSICDRYIMRLDSMQNAVSNLAFEDKGVAVAMINCSSENFQSILEELTK